MATAAACRTGAGQEQEPGGAGRGEPMVVTVRVGTRRSHSSGLPHHQMKKT